MVDEQKLRELAVAATPGPWIAGDDEDSAYFLVGPHDGDGIVYQPVVKLHSEANADYIAAANPAAILSLLDELQQLRSERTALLVNEQNLEEAVKRARVDALEEAAKSCVLIAVDKWALYKGRKPYTGQEPGRAADYTQGQSDGAELCERAIESLKGTP